MRKREVEKEKKEPERGKLVRVEWDDRSDGVPDASATLSLGQFLAKALDSQETSAPSLLCS